MKKELQLLFSRLFITSTLLLALFITLSGASFAQAVNFQGGYGSYDMTSGTCINSTERQISDSRSECECDLGYTLNSSSNGCEPVQWVSYCPLIGDPNPNEIGNRWQYARSSSNATMVDWRKDPNNPTCTDIEVCGNGKVLNGRGTSNPSCLSTTTVSPATPPATTVSTDYTAVYGYNYTTARSLGGQYRKYNGMCWRGAGVWRSTPYSLSESNGASSIISYTRTGSSITSTNDPLSASIDSSPIVEATSCIDDTQSSTQYSCTGKNPGDVANTVLGSSPTKWCWYVGSVTIVPNPTIERQVNINSGTALTALPISPSTVGSMNTPGTNGGSAALLDQYGELVACAQFNPILSYAPIGFNTCGTSSLLSNSNAAATTTSTCNTTPLLATSGLGGTTGTYCENGALWSTSNWGTSGEKYKNISDQCVNGSPTTCKYGCKQTTAGPTGGNNPSAHCMTAQEAGVNPNATIGSSCRLYTTMRNFPSIIIDKAYNLGHIQTLGGVTKCVLDANATAGGGTPGNFNDTTSAYTADTSANSCWMYTGADGMPILGGSVTSTCKDYFQLGCSAQYINRVSRTGLWNWDTNKCDFTKYTSDVKAGNDGLPMTSVLSTGSSDYTSAGGTGKFIGVKDFTAICGGLYYDNWTYPVKTWGVCQSTAALGEWNGVNPNDSSNSTTLNAVCGTGYYSAGVSANSFTGGTSGATKVVGTLSEVSSGIACTSESTFTENNGTISPSTKRWSIVPSTKSCCLNVETHVGYGFTICKNENYLQAKVNICKDACIDSGFSPVATLPSWCPNAAPKTCSCAAKYTGTQGTYQVPASQDCLTNAPATQPTTCAASVPTISCGVPTQTTITLSGSNVPTNSGACSLILSPSDYSSPSLTISSALQSTFTGQLASNLTPDKAYTASIICGGVTKASQSCRTAVATACTNGNTSQNIPSGSFNPTTMIARRVVESGAACLTTKPANVPDCILTANSGANPTLYASQQLGAPSNAIANSDVCFDTLRNRMRVAADTGCADTGVRTTPVCPLPTTPSMLSLGTTVFVNTQAVVSFTPPKANMQCGLYGRNASGVDMTNIVSPIATYSSVSPVIITLGANKQSAVQTYGYTAICTDPGTTNTVQSGIINVNVVPAPTASINPTAYDEGLATTISLCTDADKWTITRITGTERVGQGLGTTNSSAYGFETGFNIFLRSRTADIEAGNGTDGDRYTAADVELTCTKTITSTIAVGVSGSPDLSTQQNQISQTATATLKLTTLTARVLIDKDGVFSTSADRSPAAGIPVTYRSQRTSNTNAAKGDAIFVTKVGITYPNGFTLDNLPNYLEYMGTIAKDGTLSDPYSDTMPSQVAGSCASVIPDSATLARYKAVHQGTSALFNQADLDFVKSQSGKTCTAADTACNQADINGNGSVNATDVGIIRGMVRDMLVSTCALGNGFYDKDVANDTHVMLLKYKTPKLYPSIVSSTQAKVSCDIGDSLYVTKISPTPTASIISTKPYIPGTQVTFDYNPNYTYKLECANHGYATTTAMLAPELSVNVTQNPIVPISTDATVKWTSSGDSCEIKDFAGNSFTPKIEKTSTTGSFEYTFPANTPYFNMAVTHLPGATAPAATDIGLKVVCKDTSAPTVTATATANIIVYAPITASIAAPGADGKSTLSCGGTYDSAVLNIRQSPLAGNDTTLNTSITLYDKNTTPVQGAVGPWQRTLLVSQINTLTCSGPYGPSAAAVYPTGAFTLNAEINADVAQSTDKLTATSSAAEGRYTLLNWATTGEGVTCNTKMTKLLPNGSYSAPVAASSLANTSLAIPTQGTYSNNPIVKWTIECKDKNDTVLTKTLTLNVGATPLAEIGTPTYNGRYYNPSTKEGAASTYEFALKCTNATSYQVQKSVGTNWVNATGTNASGAITTNPWTGVTYKQPYMNTVDGQQFRLMCVSSLGVEAYSNKVTFSTASTYPFVTSFRTTVQTYTVTGTTEPITISPVIRNPVDCKVSVFEASDVSGFTTLSQFTAKSPASGTTASAMQTQINTVYGYDGTTQIKLNTPAFQNGTQEGKINSVNLDKAKTFILACPKYNTATQSSTVEICNQNNTSAKCIFTITKSTTGQQ